MVSLSFLSLGLTLLCAFASGHPAHLPTRIDIAKRESPLRVTLSPTVNNGEIEATLTNSGSENVSLLKLGSIFADSPIRKVSTEDEDGALMLCSPKNSHKLTARPQEHRFLFRVCTSPTTSAPSPEKTTSIFPLVA